MHPTKIIRNEINVCQKNSILNLVTWFWYTFTKKVPRATLNSTFVVFFGFNTLSPTDLLYFPINCLKVTKIVSKGCTRIFERAIVQPIKIIQIEINVRQKNSLLNLGTWFWFTYTKNVPRATLNSPMWFSLGLTHYVQPIWCIFLSIG